jgi:hypothetical protein
MSSTSGLTGKGVRTPYPPADQGHLTGTGGLASGLRTGTSASSHSHPDTGQGEPKRPLPVPPPGLSAPDINVLSFPLERRAGGGVDQGREPPELPPRDQATTAT